MNKIQEKVEKLLADGKVGNALDFLLQFGQIARRRRPEWKSELVPIVVQICAWFNTGHTVNTAIVTSTEDLIKEDSALFTETEIQKMISDFDKDSLIEYIGLIDNGGNPFIMEFPDNNPAKEVKNYNSTTNNQNTTTNVMDAKTKHQVAKKLEKYLKGLLGELEVEEVQNFFTKVEAAANTFELKSFTQNYVGPLLAAKQANGSDMDSLVEDINENQLDSLTTRVSELVKLFAESLSDDNSIEFITNLMETENKARNLKNFQALMTVLENGIPTKGKKFFTQLKNEFENAKVSQDAFEIRWKFWVKKVTKPANEYEVE